MWLNFIYFLKQELIPKKTLLIFSCVLVILLFSTTSIFAQSTNQSSVEGAASLGVARVIEIQGKDIKDGSLISLSAGKAVLSSIAYDPQVSGIVARDAGMIMNNSAITNGLPVISSGTVYVLVSSQGGPIKKGDLLTTSTIPGVAIKAENPGYVIGAALEDYDNSDPKKIETIAVHLNLHYFNSKPTFLGSLSDILKVALLPTKDAPTPIIKYIVAAIVVLGSFILGFLSFGRTAAKGVEALGRNPAASKIIHLGIIFNIAIVVVIVLAGLTVAFLILRL